MKNDEAKYFEIWLNILDLATRAREIYQRRTSEERRLLLSHIFSNIQLSDEKLIYTLKKPVEILSKRIKQANSVDKNFEQKKAFAIKTKASSASKMDLLLPR